MASNADNETKVQDITVVQSESEDDDDSQASEEFNFAVALALRKNLTETFDKHVHSSNVSDKIARFESKSAKLPPRQPPAVTRGTATAEPAVVKPLGVYLRVRPPTAASAHNEDASTLEIQPPSDGIPTTVRTFPPIDSNAAKVNRDSSDNGEMKGVKEFQFAQVFGPDSSQQDVYSTVGAPLVTGLFPDSTDKQVGESALLFAYGITNAGKTHTMMGDVKEKQSNQKWGIIPRALQDIFARMEGNDQYDLNLSYMEIYNEVIYDLLPNNKTASVRNQPEPLKIRESRQGQTFVRGLAKHCVKDVAHGLDLVERASKQRHTSSHNLNAGSSRSHCICQLELVARTPVHPAVNPNNSNDNDGDMLSGYTTDEEAAQITRSKDKTVTLWIVDLAGSERSKRTGVIQGSLRQKEAALINSSLMKLMRCLSVMRRNQNFSSASNVVPFRESKLTHLFMNHLTGPSANRTTMIVNVNPSAADFDETQHVLAYATAARTVQITQEDRKRKGGEDMEATHDYNGRALKRKKLEREPSTKSQKIASLVRKFSPKQFMPKKNQDTRKRKAVDTKKPPLGKAGSSKSLASEDAKPKQKMSRLASMRGVEKPKEVSLPLEKQIKSLQTSLSIAQAEAEVLRSEKNELEEELAECEAQVRMEVAEEMEEQMRVTREQYNEIIENLKRQVQSKASPAKSARKAQMDKAEQYLEELVDKVDECEEEMVRMRQEHAKEMESLRDEHRKAMNAKDEELKTVKASHEATIAELEKKVAQVQEQLAQSLEDYSKLDKSKKEMMENYEKLFREEEEEEDGDDDGEDSEEEESEEEESDPTPVRNTNMQGNPGSKRLPQTRRYSKVVCDTLDESIPKSSSKKKQGRQLRSKRAPFSPVNHDSNIMGEEGETSDTSSNSSFGPDKWLRPRKPVEKDTSTGFFLRPKGRAPRGREWDAKVGAWRLSEVA